ncbi:MAG: glycosyltransferase family 4 protein [Acidimicrobiales bacterium]
MTPSPNALVADASPAERTIALVHRTVPAGERVLVVTRGDDSLLDVGDTLCMHFPQAVDGSWLGYHLATGGEVVAHLELLRGRGARYFVLPTWALWWLDYYDELHRYLEGACHLIAFDEVGGLVFILERPAPSEPRVSVTPVLPPPVAKKTARAKRAAPAGACELTIREPIHATFPVADDEAYLLSGTIVGTETASARAVLVAVEFLDEEGEPIPGPYRHLTLSPREDVGWYRYFETRAGSSVHRFTSLLEPPGRAAKARLRFRKWDRAVADPLFLAGQTSLDAITSPALAQRTDGSLDDPEALRLLARLQLTEGRLGDHTSTLQRLAVLTGTEQATETYRKAAGTLRELDTTWLPVLPGRSTAATSAASIRPCHLFKVSYPFESTGGAIRNLNVVRSQRDLGLEPYVVTPLGYPATHGSDEFRDEHDVDGVRHVHLRVHGDGTSLPADRRLTLDTIATAAIIRRCGADLIHAASGFRGYELALKGIALARHFGIPLVYEVRSLHEHLWGSPRMRDKLGREWTQLRIAQENRCMGEADAVVTISRAMREVLVARGVAEDKITIIPNAVDVAAFEPAAPDLPLKRRLGLPDGAPVVGYISNVSHREGHDVLLRGFAAVARVRDDVRCLVVGDGPERTGIERLAASLGIGDRVVFTGEVDHREIRRYYSIIDVFVVPRRPDYAADHVTPLKPFEALALERAMIVSDLPSLREIVGEEERGLLFRPEDPAALARRIGDLLDDPARRRTLGGTGRAWILRERTWDRNAERYLELYQSVLGSFGDRDRRMRS